MTATERVRELLDERGVKWMPVAWNPKRETFYHAANGVGFCADEYTDGVKIYTDATITPEQAVAATMGDADATSARQSVADLKAENAKLRELVDGWDFCSKTKSATFDNCVGCPLFIQTPHSYRCARDERMRELGIEVDG